MCLIALAINLDENYPFIFISNRDEFFQRPTQSMFWWKDEDILAGKDLKAGGTWLAVNSKRQIAAVTNYRDPTHNNPNAPSRGAVPVNLLKDSPDDFSKYANTNNSLWSKMNGFNLFYHDGIRFFHYSNITQQTTELITGIYGISNALLDTPWPKVIQIKNDLKEMLNKNAVDDKNLFRLLTNHERYPDVDLPNTGIGLDWERALSPICIQSPIYGTRTHTVILKNRTGKLQITEKQAKLDETVSFIV